MQSAREFVEDYLRKGERFFKAAEAAFPGTGFQTSGRQAVLDVSELKRNPANYRAGADGGMTVLLHAERARPALPEHSR